MTPEQAEVLGTFTEMLRIVTADGGTKRARGEKPSWKVDPSHEAAIFSHLNKWKHGEKTDPDSGSHPLVHVAWRALAIAWQEGQSETLKANVKSLSSILQEDFATKQYRCRVPYCTVGGLSILNGFCTAHGDMKPLGRAQNRTTD